MKEFCLNGGKYYLKYLKNVKWLVIRRIQCSQMNGIKMKTEEEKNNNIEGEKKKKRHWMTAVKYEK